MPVAASRAVCIRHTQVRGERPAGDGDKVHCRFMTGGVWGVQIDAFAEI